MTHHYTQISYPETQTLKVILSLNGNHISHHNQYVYTITIIYHHNHISISHPSRQVISQATRKDPTSCISFVYIQHNHHNIQSQVYETQNTCGTIYTHNHKEGKTPTRNRKEYKKNSKTKSKDFLISR